MEIENGCRHIGRMPPTRIAKMENEDYLKRKRAFINSWLAKNSMNEDLVRKSIWAFRNDLSANWRDKALNFIENHDKEKFEQLTRLYLKPDSSREITLITAPR